MNEVNLEEKIKNLELELADSNNKLRLNKQYSDTLEEEILEINNKNINYDFCILTFIIFILFVIVVILYKKNLVLSKLNKRNINCDKFIMRWLYAWY